jgi:hypothetical protein
LQRILKSMIINGPRKLTASYWTNKGHQTRRSLASFIAIPVQKAGQMERVCSCCRLGWRSKKLVGGSASPSGRLRPGAPQQFLYFCFDPHGQALSRTAPHGESATDAVLYHVCMCGYVCMRT